jgi:hypothetical protein
MPAGRPRKQIDGDGVFKLACLGCTNEEIGDFFGCHADTIRNNFSGELALGRSGMKISLRRLQMKSARAGSVPMQIHLGKQYLGQADKVQTATVPASGVRSFRAYVDGEQTGPGQGPGGDV